MNISLGYGTTQINFLMKSDPKNNYIQPNIILFLNTNICHKIRYLYIILNISNSFLPTQLFDFYRHESLSTVFIMCRKQSTNVCSLSSLKGVNLPIT